MKYTIFIILLVGILAGAVGLLTGKQQNTPGFRAEYADRNNDGFVEAQGDPLWDQHYANQVNVPNSQAKENLGQAEQYQAAAELQQAMAKKVQADTFLTNLLVGAAVVIILLVVGVIILGIMLRSQNEQY